MIQARPDSSLTADASLLRRHAWLLLLTLAAERAAVAPPHTRDSLLVPRLPASPPTCLLISLPPRRQMFADQRLPFVHPKEGGNQANKKNYHDASRNVQDLTYQYATEQAEKATKDFSTCAIKTVPKASRTADQVQTLELLEAKKHDMDVWVAMMARNNKIRDDAEKAARG
eukprot:COSAG01_NODE_5110_length_4475_cov_3.906764_6_plen_171_part_00